MDPIERSLARAWPVDQWADTVVVVAVSGGADSVALWRCLNAVHRHAIDTLPPARRGRLILAHYNHRRRGEASDADQAFCDQLARQCGQEFATADQPCDSGDEATMASRRKAFLRQTARRTGARWIATAHHTDDNVETFLHHLLRGTGTAGLAAMQPFTPEQDWVWVKPFFGERRESLRHYLQRLDQPFREDATNLQTVHTRNWIRGELLPTIRTRFPKADASIHRAAGHLRQTRSFIDRFASDWLQTHQIATGPVRCIVRTDPTMHAAVAVAAMQALWRENRWSSGDMTAEHWQTLARSLSGDTTADGTTLPGNIQVRATADELELRAIDRGRARSTKHH